MSSMIILEVGGSISICLMEPSSSINWDHALEIGKKKDENENKQQKDGAESLEDWGRGISEWSSVIKLITSAFWIPCLRQNQAQIIWYSYDNKKFISYLPWN